MALIRYFFRFALLSFMLIGMSKFAFSADPVKISPDSAAVDLSGFVEISLDQGSSFRITTPPDPEGIIHGIEVQANGENSQGNWAVLTLANPSDRQLDRLIVAPHYRLAGSGLLDPDLGSIRIQSITPSEGFTLERQASPDSDVFRFTINPGAVVTLVAELGSRDLPQLYLWEPDAYKDTVNSYTLYRGILLGISGLLALLLTILFVVKGTSLFPATAAFAWAVLGYICVDFSFLNKLFNVVPNSEPLWRAGTEVALAGTILVFLFTYLHLHRWHYHFSFGIVLWLGALCGLGGMVLIDPVQAAGFARVSLGATALIGVLLICYLTIRGYDRAIMLVPSWILFILWLVAAYAAVTGKLDNDIVQPALAGGLVLIVLLLSFTVMQHAFSSGAGNQGIFSDLERQALAVMGTDQIVWDWDVVRDRVVTTPDLSIYIGSAAKSLIGPMRNWLPAMHSDDRDRFRMTLDAILDTRAGRLDQTFRLRAGDSQYRWFSLRARPVIGPDGEIIRCVGMLMDVTEHKKAEERLLHNSIYDSLTGLPNRQLFLDRLQAYCDLAQNDENLKPTLLIIDFDNFRSINQRYGLSVGDTFLLAMARRLARHLKPLDTLSRISSDRFAFLLASQNDLSKVANFTINLKKALNMPISFAKREVQLTASIGLLPWLGGTATAEDRLNDGILAMFAAKYNGGNKIEPFRPVFRSQNIEKRSIDDELREALSHDQINVVYHPVLKIADGTLVGFEAMLQWDHPSRGTLFTQDFISAAENAGITMELANFVLHRAAQGIALLNQKFPGNRYFVSVNLPSADLLRNDLVTGIQSMIVRNPLREGQLLIEMPEAVLMQNPELSVSLFERLKGLGVGLVLDNFGTGYSSLSYFVRFPFDIIKLDRSLLNNERPKQNILLRSLIGMAHDLGFQVIAEGVESEGLAIMLKNAKCEYLQSNTFSMPIAIESVLELIANHKK
ncbi:sensor domain-containing phosphodiesterase [Bartonella sp. HY329]|nr:MULTISPECIES: sensor domain-containing phosphodiesterase [unclassified Bartonella]UXM94092.1 sensor domain-containing phosphodiesterase [Bartonella sp. HY329]UXN08414.1 sensor domain-containing phosphodiesterase [Bartonella sp. HY328]